LERLLARLHANKDEPAYPLSSADLPWQILRNLTDGEA
jgi:hypothetical protein